MCSDDLCWMESEWSLVHAEEIIAKFIIISINFVLGVSKSPIIYMHMLTIVLKKVQ